MAPSPLRPAAGSSQAEVVLLPQLKSCLVNLPSSLVAVLSNANTIAQNVVIELNYRPPTTSGADGKLNVASTPRAVYVGWTGMQSQTKLAPVVDRSGIRGSRGGRQEQDVATVELDSALGRTLGIAHGTKVSVSLHLDPPQAHTVNIEPLTPTDWDIIELHANFLEMNFLSQIRALPNPAFSGIAQSIHPLTLHLTPTSTANIIVTGLEPSPNTSQAFVKVSPDAEVIVAPKSRQNARSEARDSRSVASASKRSVGGRSAASTMRNRSTRDAPPAKTPVFLRGVDRKVAEEWFDGVDTAMADDGLRVWVDKDVILSKSLKGITWAAVSVVRPTGLEEPLDPQKASSEQEKPASKVVARLLAWDDAPDSRHAALSSMLCASLGVVGLVGGIVRIEAAPLQLPKTTSALKQPSKDGGKEIVVRSLRVAPFISTASTRDSSISFGGQSKAEQERAVQRIKALFGGSGDGEHGLLDGPLTHGMIIPAETTEDVDRAWPGGILRFEPSPTISSESSKRPLHWLLGEDRKLGLEVQPQVSKPIELSTDGLGEELPSTPPTLVGINILIEKLQTNLLHLSSILLTGGLGSGKTSIVQALTHTLRKQYLYHTIYFPCRTLITDETRVSTIKEMLQRLFGLASWGARLGGRSIVILDDLDKLCPVETELQVGGENGRSRQISELVCSIAKKHCSRDSGVVLLATAQAKESVNNVIIGGHVVRDILSVKAPSKDGRRQVLESMVYPQAHHKSIPAEPDLSPKPQPPSETNGHPWMDGSEGDHESAVGDGPGFTIDSSIDLLEIAGQTDGYMPGDLGLLVARARSEALIRSVSTDDDSNTVTFSSEDFTAALKGFTPASLRNVTLQSSTTTFSSIGGLQSTRQTLLETLQYPTTYAPIFAQCPLRLRSGLLLYGYPGCGKTMLASAVAGECGLNFISVKGPEILNKYIGASEKSVRDLFERAEAARPCVLFFDEFDSIAPKRGHDSTGVTDRVVNQLLTQMDGAEGLSGVYVLAATSRPDMIDPALLRPGRLDKSLLCDMPSLEDRIDILKAVTGKLKLHKSLENSQGPESLTEIARQTEGYSGADLQAVMYNAHLEAIHDVLGSAEGMDDQLGKSKDERSGSKTKHRDFSYFKVGDDEAAMRATTADPAHASPAVLAQRSTIAAKLSAIEVGRKKAKQQRHAASTGNDTQDKQRIADVGEESQEPIISWKHVVESLKSTRQSISSEEQKRLRAIYREFIVGRNGEMPNGQGGNEIGGRTSLM